MMKHFKIEKIQNDSFIYLIFGIEKEDLFFRDYAAIENKIITSDN